MFRHQSRSWLASATACPPPNSHGRLLTRRGEVAAGKWVRVQTYRPRRSRDLVESPDRCRRHRRPQAQVPPYGQRPSEGGGAEEGLLTAPRLCIAKIRHDYL